MKLLLFLSILFLFACRTSPANKNTLQLSQDVHIELLDSTAASQAIIKDEVNSFFKKISKVDMGIQVKQVFTDSISRNDILPIYKNYLQQDVANFTDEEIIFIKKIMKQVFRLYNKLSPSLFPKEIKLIKTKEMHYGEGVYYTRENCVIIPYGELEILDEESFLEVMIHEVAHIVTRYNPELKQQLYKEIGFHPIKEKLEIPDSLAAILLLNPDGINCDYYISIIENGDTIQAVPLIRANSNYQKEKIFFFDYLKFDLFELENTATGKTIKTKNATNSTIDYQVLPHFFQQITNNTDYIIHPDEIIADHFIFLALDGEEENGFGRFDEDGRVLLLRMEEVLKDME